MKYDFERLEHESSKAFEGFVAYRDMGITRSIREVAEKLGKSRALLERWSSKYQWVDRARAYDDYMDKKAILENEKLRREMVKRHASASTMFQSKVVSRLNTFDPNELSPNDLIKWFEVSVKIERLSRGESTDISEVTHSGEVKETHEYNLFQRVDQYADVYKKMSERGTISSTDESDDN